MPTVVLQSQFASGLAPFAEGAPEAAAAAPAMPAILVIGATILVALALRTASRAVASIAVQIARSLVPASMAALMMLSAFALLVYFTLTRL